MDRPYRISAAVRVFLSRDLTRANSISLAFIIDREDTADSDGSISRRLNISVPSRASAHIEGWRENQMKNSSKIKCNIIVVCCE